MRRVIRSFLSFSLLMLSSCVGGPQQNVDNAESDELVELRMVEADARLPPRPGQFVGTFDPDRAIFPIRRKSGVSGVPDSLTGARVLHDFVDRDQFFYQSYHVGDVSESLYQRISEGIDSTTLLSQWVDDVLISAVVGESPRGDRIVLVDTDGNGDFTGEPELEFVEDTLRLGTGVDIPIHSSLATIHFEYVEDGRLQRGTVDARFFYEGGSPPEQLAWDVPSYRIGTWTVRGEEYGIALGSAPVLRPGKYTFLYIDVDHDGSFDPSPEGLEAYSTDEPFSLGGYSWSIADLPANGSMVAFERMDVAVPPRTALREGEEALPVVAETLSGDSVTLSELRGQHVLLNFGWTGCAFSLAELPFLRDAYESFRNHGLVILSLVEAEDDAALREYVDRHELPWPHAHQNRTDEIARRYRVMGTPTNYLIGPDGFILATGKSLRGDSLIVTLDKLLGDRNGR